MNGSPRHSAGVCTDPKRLTEDPVLRSTIRHQFKIPTSSPVGIFFAYHRVFTGVGAKCCGLRICSLTVIPRTLSTLRAIILRVLPA
jgi:hypothetical protein